MKGARSAFRSGAEEWSRKAEPGIARFLPQAKMAQENMIQKGIKNG